MRAGELQASWQGRALAWTGGRGNLAAVLMSLFADSDDEAFPFLMRAVFPEWRGVLCPFICSSPKIDKAGRIVADVALRGGQKVKDYTIFNDETQMESVFRRLADRLKFDDSDRIALFDSVRAWVKADMRLDPAMDRRDPDAKRLTVN